MKDDENHLIELLKDADVNHAKAILDILKENNINEESFISFFLKLKMNIQLDLLDNWPYSTNLLYNIINCSKDGLVINKIVHTYNVELNSPKIDIEQFFSKAKKINLEDAADVVCMNCVEDTLNDNSCCEKCPVRKTMDYIKNTKENVG